ncbi:MAG: hypothetical protein LQ346_008487 [Caloplaca aetnensis]|nr:MAG: hypothetical protein LQ346_008487 [Caloplaca aetnensis]
MAEQAKPRNDAEKKNPTTNASPNDYIAKTTDDEGASAWKLPKLVTDFSQFIGSSGMTAPKNEAVGEGVHKEQDDAVEITTQAVESNSTEAEPVSAQSASAMTGKDVEEGASTVKPEHVETFTSSSLEPGAAVMGATTGHISAHCSPVSDPRKYAWPAAYQADPKKKLIDF